jgi:hypothetical protein
MVLAQTTDMVTYGDTMRKKSASHSAIRPVNRGPVSGKHAAGAKHTASARRTASAKHTVSAQSGGSKHASAKHRK